MREIENENETDREKEKKRERYCPNYLFDRTLFSEKGIRLSLPPPPSPFS